MREISEYLKESILSDIDTDIDNTILADQFKAEFIAVNKWSKYGCSFDISNNKVDIKLNCKDREIIFNQKLSTICRRFKINTVNISGIGSLHLENAKNLTFNVQETVLLGGNWKKKSLIKDCTINCNKVIIAGDAENKKDVVNVTINTKFADIAPKTRKWTNCTVRAGVIIAPYIRLIPEDMNYYCKGKYDFREDFDYTNLKTTKKTGWSPEDLFSGINIDSDVIVLRDSVSNFLFRERGLVEPNSINKVLYYMTKFVKGGSGEFGGYELVFDSIPDDKYNTTFNYIDNLI